MDSQDGLRARLSGAGCTVCGAAVPGDRIVILADRDDLAFVELRCGACGSATLGLVLGGSTGDADIRLADVSGHPELGPADEARLVGRGPVTLTDVVRMRRFLAAWDGDLRSLLDGPGAPGAGSV